MLIVYMQTVAPKMLHIIHIVATYSTHISSRTSLTAGQLKYLIRRPPTTSLCSIRHPQVTLLEEKASLKVKIEESSFFHLYLDSCFRKQLYLSCSLHVSALCPPSAYLVHIPSTIRVDVVQNRNYPSCCATRPFRCFNTLVAHLLLDNQYVQTVTSRRP